MNVPDTKFPRNTMKLLNHNASTLNSSTASADTSTTTHSRGCAERGQGDEQEEEQH